MSKAKTTPSDQRPEKAADKKKSKNKEPPSSNSETTLAVRELEQLMPSVQGAAGPVSWTPCTRRPVEFPSGRAGRVQVDRVMLEALLAEQRALSTLKRQYARERERLEAEALRHGKVEREAERRELARAWSNKKQRMKTVWAKERECAKKRYPKERVRPCPMQGRRKISNSISEGCLYSNIDPMSIMLTRLPSLAPFRHQGLKVAQFEANLRPRSVSFHPYCVKLNGRVKSEGQHWVQPVPSYLILSGDSNTAVISLCNFYDRGTAIRVTMTNASSFRLRPRVGYLRPFECRTVEVEFRRTHDSPSPREHLCVCYADDEDFENARSEFDELKLDDVWAGKSIVTVVVQNWHDAARRPWTVHPLPEMTDGVHRAKKYCREFRQKCKQQNIASLPLKLTESQRMGVAILKKIGIEAEHESKKVEDNKIAQ